MGTRRLGIITAVAVHLAGHLEEAAASVLAARRECARAGWQLHWSVALDGEGATADLERGLAGRADTVTRLGGRHGVSAARNVALSAPALRDTSWVTVLDGDDVLDPAGIAQLVARLDELGAHDATAWARHDRPGEIAWVATNRMLLGGGVDPSWGSWIASERPFAPGEVNATYRRPFAFHPNGVTYRTDVLRRARGWPAAPGGEDLALLLVVSREHAGLAAPILTLHYRNWGLQTVAQPSFAAASRARYALYESWDLLGGRSGADARGDRGDRDD